MSIRSKFVVLGLTTALALSACGVPVIPVIPVLPIPIVQGTPIGATGGTVTGPDGVSVVIPAGALPANTTIKITKSSVGAPDAQPTGFSLNAGGDVYQIEPHDVTFAAPVTIRLPIPAGNTSPVVYASETGTGWYPHKSTVKDGFVELQRTGFSYYSVNSWSGKSPSSDYFIYTVTSGIKDNQTDGKATSYETDPGKWYTDVISYASTEGTWVLKQNAPASITLNAFNRWLNDSFFDRPLENCNNPKVQASIRVDGTQIWIPLPALDMVVNRNRSTASVTYTPPIPGKGSMYFGLNCNGVTDARKEIGIKVNFTVLPTQTVTGTVTGLPANTSVQLTNATANNVLTGQTSSTDVTSSGAFSFPSIANGESYAITVKTQPTDYNCVVTNGSGTITSADVTNVAVNCTEKPYYTIGGTVSGLTSGLFDTAELQLNGSETIGKRNGSFVFATKVLEGGTYAVTVPSQGNSTCSVENGSGTVGTANITNVIVTCVPLVLTVQHKVSGIINGLPAGQGFMLTVSLNESESILINVDQFLMPGGPGGEPGGPPLANPMFEFTTKIEHGGNYIVTTNNPTSTSSPNTYYYCNVTPNTTQVANEDVNVVINCTGD